MELVTRVELLSYETQRLVEVEMNLQEECEKVQLLQLQLQEQKSALPQEISCTQATQFVLPKICQQIGINLKKS